MNRSDWLILGILALIWGGAFFFIGVAVRHVPPLTYVWMRLTIAAAAMWTYLKLRGQPLGLPREVWGSIVLLALLNNALPFTLFGWGQTHIASGLASILNATTPIWGVARRAFPHRRRADEPAQDRRRIARLRRRRDDDRPRAPLRPRHRRPRATCLRHRVAQLCAGGRLGAPLPSPWRLAAQRHDRPADRRRRDDAAVRRSSSTSRGLTPFRRSARGRRSRRWHCSAPPSATCCISA